MATTLKTYYTPSNISSDPEKLIKVYDSENPSESALAIQVNNANAKSVWWVNSKKESYLVWKMKLVEVGQYYLWGVQGDVDDDRNPMGDIVDLINKLEDDISEADILGLRMKKTAVGEIINEENPTPINGYIVVISDGNKPGLKNEYGVDYTTWEKVKEFTDINGKNHAVWCFPYLDLGGVPDNVKNLKIN